MSRKVSLTVNGKSIELNKYVEGYVYYIANGIVNSLKGTSAVKKLEIDIDSDGQVSMTLNGNSMPLNVFVMQIIRNTMAGMVTDLKGVDKGMKNFSLRIS